jgi:hypothetical protein
VSEARAAHPRSGELFAPLPLAALALLVVNDVWLKPAFHSAVTGKLSDVALCFVMPLFFSELLGLAFGLAPRARLRIGALFAAALFTAQEVVPPFTALALRALHDLGARFGLRGAFRMTRDWTDLLCLPLVIAAVAYGQRKLKAIEGLELLRVPEEESSPGRREHQRSRSLHRAAPEACVPRDRRRAPLDRAGRRRDLHADVRARLHDPRVPLPRRG